MQGGAILYDSQDPETTVSTFFANLAAMLSPPQEPLPNELAFHVSLLNDQDRGLVLMVDFTWFGPPSANYTPWLAKFMALATSFIPLVVFPGRICTATLHGLVPSPEAIAVILDLGLQQPASAGTALRRLWSRGAATLRRQSVFRN